MDAKRVRLVDLRPRDRDLVVQSERMSLGALVNRAVSVKQALALLQRAEDAGTVSIQRTRRAILITYKVKGGKPMTARIQRYGKKAGLGTLVT